MNVGDRVRLAGPDNIDGTVVPTPAWGVGTWVRWDDAALGAAGAISETDPASLEQIGEETPRRKRR